MGGEEMAEIPEAVREVLEMLEAAGYESWCVGGCVRDSMLGREPMDWDVTSSARPQEIQALFGDRAVPTGILHGTVTVRIGEQSVEVTTFRRDGTYRDHRRPQTVSFTTSLEEDLQRRDYTVNAMALGLRGELRDPLGGRADLTAGVLRCVGEPDCRFSEDALRILRGLRFAAVLGFSLHPATARSIHRNRELLREIAAERIWAELTALLIGPWAAPVLREYPDVLGVFWPEILPMVGFDQRNRHHCYDVWEHTLHALEEAPPDPVLRLTMLLHDIGKPACFTVDRQGSGHFYGHPAAGAQIAEGMLRRLRADRATRETVVRLIQWHDRDIPRTRQGIGRAVRLLGVMDLRRLLAVKQADNLAQAPAYRQVQVELRRAETILEELLAENACLSLQQLAVDGRDLMAIGLRGRQIGAALDAALQAVIDGELPNEREALLAYARQYNSPSIQ